MGNSAAANRQPERDRWIIRLPRLSVADGWRFVMSCAIFLTCSCGGEKPADDSGDVLLSMGSKILTLHEVEDKIPVGIDPADSVALFREIIGNWVTTAVISEFAESKLPDMEEIDRRVEDYRNRLIVTEYLRRMKESRQPKISQDSIREYYDIHRNELLTESPLVKGIYIKVPSSIKGIDEIRQLVFSGTEEDIDRLENDWMEAALQYDYFGNKWIDWQVLADQIPYRFHSPDSFLESSRNFETTNNGSTYIFHISEYLPSGSVQPYEFAAAAITEVLEQSKISTYEKALVSSLVKKAVKDGRLVPGAYDPLRHTLVRRKTLTKNNETK
ncbi:hypothetical protein [Lepagella muris]|jgi:hypothetical protein|uniref:Uncharacterized protein n=1 Tax=Lepagella muris TaxID=3032870 RepID=A0AC61RF13_9BACT|nr:hypothetical protein [Lepagella muris]ROT03637.1 hypothetical protein EEL33_16930 [Muribaculaceae bacterium Isolate-037 (Harlan)]TGY77303.1 hypothetical protein E5331_15315 [Lepagella muris]THG49508.1 hypothetical protein E5984_14835 [Bacteroidales bacterium]TKC54747.1 hypothetical protein E5359_016575 [Bacteroidales bacterium]